MAQLSSELSCEIGGHCAWVLVGASALIAQAVIGPSLTGLEASYTDFTGT
jgi:hypothetical protein